MNRNIICTIKTSFNSDPNGNSQVYNTLVGNDEDPGFFQKVGTGLYHASIESCEIEGLCANIRQLFTRVERSPESIEFVFVQLHSVAP